MKRWIFSWVLVAACGGVQAGEGAGGNADIAQFLDGMRFVTRLDADVTGDGVADTVLVAAHDSRFEAVVTVLMRLHGKPVVGTGVMKGLEGIDSLTVELSPHGPPTVKVVKNVLIVESIVGGATVRTASTYRYRFDAEEGRMRLIGLDAERTSTTFGIKLSWNVLTGTLIVRRGDREGAAIRYGPETRSTDKQTPIYMSLTPNPEELLDRALNAKPKGK